MGCDQAVINVEGRELIGWLAVYLKEAGTRLATIERNWKLAKPLSSLVIDLVG
jgi:hypothetical protein